uniref:Conjugation TrbI family protein n=2 Tax=Gloeothece TaxID=28070 RepID=E0UKT8_GLOV7|nr:conserved hypothetical protein [Gloeothece verrucosa PCC 7822]
MENNNSSKTIFEDLRNAVADYSHLANETSDWESRMAKLVGLENEIISKDEKIEENSFLPEISCSEAQKEQTQQTFSSNPFMKLGLVGVTTLIIFVLAGGFLWQIMNINQQSPKNKNVIISQPKQETKSYLQNLETEVENLKTKLAFSEQEEAIKLAQQTLRSKKTTQSSATFSPSPVSFPKTKNINQVKTIYVPRIVTVEKIVKVAQPVYKPSSKPSPKPHILPMVSAQNSSQNNVNQPINTRTTYSPPPQNSVPQPVNYPVPNPIQQTPPSTQTPYTPTPTPQIVNSSTVSQATSQVPKTIPVGTSAKAILTTAVFGETSKSNNSEQEANVFVITLQEPLKTPDEEIAFPANAQLLTKISSLTDQGLLYLTVNKVIWDNNNNTIEKTLAKGSLVIRAPKGKPLFAEKFPKHGGSIATMDLGLFVLGGLGKVSQLFNRTRSEVVTTNVAGTIITNNNNSPNLAAGVLEGGLNAVIPQITQRNQQQLAEMLQRTNIWFLAAGTEVEVYVNQPMQF